MNVLRSFLGPKSKYNKEIPYTYEARVPVEMLEGEFNFYLADTICGLIEKLHRDGVEADKVQIFECGHQAETEIEKKFWLSKTGGWLFKPEICRSFEEHYPGHIHARSCSFEDRDKRGYGPF
ncbi:MAG: hypothetical protein HQL69_24705 [Magnetococcales bacterium]|nr:hypothetical protein [Magnetococcales bacterium]